MLKLLIVDDDENNRAVMQDALECDEYELIEACDGFEALKVMEETTPDLILLDVLMPGLDGIATLRRIFAQDKWQHIPVIMVTAMNMDSQVAACLDEGAIDHITKPFSGVVLRARVRAALRSRAAQAESSAFINRRGRVLSFIGAKGGVGNTTVAVNIAAALAKTDRNVSVAEIRNDPGTLSRQLAISPIHHLGELVEEAPELMNRERIQNVLTKHSSGLMALLGPQHFATDNHFNGEQTIAIINSLSTLTEMALLDLPPRANEVVASALRQSDYTVLSMELEPSSLAATLKLAEWLESLGIKGHNLGAIVTNRGSTASNSLNLLDLRSELPCDVLGTVPPDLEGCQMALRSGMPVTLSRPESLMAETLRELAGQLCSDQPATIAAVS